MASALGRLSAFARRRDPGALRIGRRPRRSSAGFSLIEILVALTIVSLLAGAGAAVALRGLRGNLRGQTVERMRAIVEAMIGEPGGSSAGYLGDMGELPDTALTQLVILGTQPPAVPDAVDGILSGWNGPYLLRGIDDTAPVDFWNSPFSYTPGVAQLTSAGPDRQMGTDDDIAYPPVAPVLSGTVTVLVKGQLTSGGPPIALRSDEATVQVFYTRASDNTRSAATVSYTGAQGSGVWMTASALHRGDHGVLVTGQDATGSGGRDFSGSLSRSIVRIEQGPVNTSVLLDEAP